MSNLVFSFEFQTVDSDVLDSQQPSKQTKTFGFDSFQGAYFLMSSFSRSEPSSI